MGYNAVGAEIVATVHNGNPRFVRNKPLNRHSFGYPAVRGYSSVRAGRAFHPSLALHYAKDHFGKSPKRCRVQQPVDMLVAAPDFFSYAFLPGHAAGKDNYLRWVFALRVHKPPDRSENSVFSILAYCASIKDKNISVFRVGYRIAHLGKHAAHTFRVGFILLTAISVDARRVSVILRCNPLYAFALVLHFLFADKFAQ
jgi:hypothetical protein